MRFSALASLTALALFATVVSAATEGELRPFKRGAGRKSAAPTPPSRSSCISGG
jgi:hypothetical protein